ncbi:MAG: ubiquinol-cytochrome C chaperone family protein [Rhodospirillales bacterium]|nr:ubiquinol-cytochrome C chaperone family protein [Rhodospirillales bacterium]
MRLLGVFHRRAEKSAAHALYRAIVRQSRLPEFYATHGVPDTPDGRFDLIVAHTVLVMRRLHRMPSRTRALSQALFDLMFADMDQNLREMGVGDLAVGKRIKAMAKGFYGRLAAYDRALTAENGDDLKTALCRNLYRKANFEDGQVAAVATYLRREAERLDAEPLDALLAGRLRFDAPAIQPVEARDA